MQELTRVLADPPAPLGPLFNVPALPPHFQQRLQNLQAIRATVLANELTPIAIISAQHNVALQGIGGVGKSVLAAAYARDYETRRIFPDGIVWFNIGQQPDLVSIIKEAGSALGDESARYTDLKLAVTRLASVLAGRVCLLILDDLWTIEHVEIFVNAVGPRCRLLLTTRDASLVIRIGARAHRVETLSPDDSLKLLADWSQEPVESLPPEASNVARECGNLPLALAQCGAMARPGIHWSDLLEALLHADVSFIAQRLPNYPYTDIFKAFQASLDYLAVVDKTAARCFLELAVFPIDEVIPEAAAVTLWTHGSGLSERQARKLVTMLHSRALVERAESDVHGPLFSLHDLLGDFVRAAHKDLRPLHDKLVRAYKQECKRGWHTGPNDGYFFKHLSYHLKEAGHLKELRELLVDFEWMRAKLENVGVNSLIRDYALLAEEPEFRMIGEAIQSSAHVVQHCAKQLASQLTGRLLRLTGRHIQLLLKKISRSKCSSTFFQHFDH